MESLEHSVQNHSEFNQVCQKLKLLLKEQRDKIREYDKIVGEKDAISQKINILKVNTYGALSKFLLTVLILFPLGN